VGCFFFVVDVGWRFAFGKAHIQSSAKLQAKSERADIIRHATILRRRSMTELNNTIIECKLVCRPGNVVFVIGVVVAIQWVMS
jgi:hypothetical protein